jgi:hypothetical protein
MNTIVSFNSDFPAICKNDIKVGFELSQHIYGALTKSGFEIIGPSNREGWAWGFLVQKNGYQIEAIFGYVNDEQLQWLITMHVHLSLVNRIFHKKKTSKKSTVDLMSFCNAINDLLYNDEFNNIRWYAQEKFDKNELERWSPSP